MFLQNAWYAAGWSEALTATPIRRVFLDEAVAMYRGEDGAAVAIGDVCPHRFASLSGGRVVSDALECPYHGLRFDRTGACIYNPHGERVIPLAAKVRSYPLVERHHAMWIWMGDPSLADPTQIPDLSIFDAPEFETSRDALNVKADYRLINDNLLDLSHAAYLHPFLTTQGFAERSLAKFEQEERMVHSFVWNGDEAITPLFKLIWDRDAERADMWSHMHWTAPSSLFLEVGLTDVGGKPEDGPAFPSAHLLTPESEHSTHYFWMVGRNRKQDDEELTRTIHAGMKQAFELEDEPMIAQIAANMAGRDFWSMKPAILTTDGAAVRARRMLDKLMRQENEHLSEAAE